jgi:hypothetical protein
MGATMYRMILLAFVVHAACVSVTVGNDYILRIDTVEYTDGPASEIESRKTTLRSIEVIARPDFPFRGRVSMGAETIVLVGKLGPADNGEFQVQLKHEHSLDTGAPALGKDGSKEPRIDVTFFEAVVTVRVDASLNFAGLLRQESRTGEQVTQTKIRHVVTLTKYDPLRD